jgi:hypothetical protein
MPQYTSKITDAKTEFFLAQNAEFMDIWFDILCDGVVVAKRRFSYPMGTPEEKIRADVANYPIMFENDIKTAAVAEANAKAKAEGQKVLEALKQG